MKILSLAEQMNACIKHANRNNLKIKGVEIYEKKKLDNHNVIVMVGEGGEYFSVAVLINIKNGSFFGCNESTWDIGRN